MCGSEMWKWNKAHRSRLCVVEINYLRGACGMTRWDGDSNESVYVSCGVENYANGVNCGVVQWVKRRTMLRWFGHIERMESEEFVKKVYTSESVDPNSRGRPPGRWRDRVEEYMWERGDTRGGGLDQARMECLNRERWRLFCCGYTFGEVPRGSEASKL